MKISIIIPTKNAQNYIDDLLKSLFSQTIVPYEVIIIDSESNDKTKEISLKYDKVKFVSIKQSEFNHGKTRNDGAKLATGDFLVFMTQDALPCDNSLLYNLTKNLGKNNVMASYARQIAKEDASCIEKFSRNFNYPEFDVIKSKEDIKTLGVKAFFFSNVCSCFVKDYFFEIGAFPEDVIMNEDMIIASKILFDNKKTMYVSDASVYHSHNYSLVSQFKRNFDVGVVFEDGKSYFENIKNESEGIKFVKEASKYFLKNKKIYVLPYFVIQSVFKFIGYKMGKNYKKLPLNLVKKCSMHSFYFKD